MGYTKKRINKFSIGTLVILIIIISVFRYYQFVNSPVSNKNKSIEFKITNGMSSNRIVDKLYSNGLISSMTFAKLYIRVKGLDGNLKAGVYKLNYNMTPQKIFSMIKNHEIDLDFVKFTIPEGYTVKQIAHKLLGTGLIKDENDFYNELNNDAFNYEFLKKLPQDRTYRLEGYLFPDTYEFEKGMTVNYMVNEMLKSFNRVYEEIKPIADSKNISIDKVIILASMVEGEAKLDSERPIIVSVFYNRLKQNMKLQIDATVEYALGVHKEVLHYKDLEADSHYNTYKYPGLPSGPICNPGKKSILAALNPENTNYIYYIAKGDGGHYFTDSYKKFLNFKNSLKNEK